jgi:hypothetical protein
VIKVGSGNSMTKMGFLMLRGGGNNHAFLKLSSNKFSGG